MAKKVNIDDGLFPWLGNRIWNALRGRIFAFIATVICVCAAWLALEYHIDAKLISWTTMWIVPLDRAYAIGALYTIIAIGVIAYIYNHIKKNAHLPYSGWVLWTLLTIVYSYYRFSKTSPFEFWGYNNWAWLDVIYVLDGLFVISALSYGVRVLYYEIRDEFLTSDLIRDDAIENEEDDDLDYVTIAEDLKVRTDAVDLSSHAFSIGIAGDWGVGKSSLLNLFANQQSEAGQIVIRFAPRSAKKADLIQEEFFAEFKHELGKYSYNAHHIISKYGYALNLSSSTKWIYNILDLFEDWTSESEKERINDLIRSTGKRVYVIIEDLDRLTGQEILEVLKLIDANGNFCNTVFITAYDKKYVNTVLRKMLGYEDSLTYFTDKYFQYEMPMFRQTDQPVSHFLSTRMKAWAEDQWGDDTYQRRIIMNEWSKVEYFLTCHLTNMRQTKRYVNLFRTVYKKNKTHVDFGDCAIITLIRYLDVESYYAIYAKEYVQHPGNMSIQRGYWILNDNYAELASNSKIPAFDKLLVYLFNGAGSYRQYETKYNKIYRAESFDNYFHTTIFGKYYCEDWDRLMNAKSRVDAEKEFDTYRLTELTKRSITEYLCMHDADWIGGKERLMRYLEILVYVYTKIGGWELSQKISDMMHNDIVAKFDGRVSKDEYAEILKKMFFMMSLDTARFMGAFMKERLNQRYKAENYLNEELFDSLEFDEKVLMDAQHDYDDNNWDLNWDARASLHLGLPVQNEDEEYAQKRIERLKKMMIENADEYAQGSFVFNQSQYDKSYTLIELFNYEEVGKALGTEMLENWVKAIRDDSIRVILARLVQNWKEKGNAIERIEQFIENPENNYAKVAECLMGLNNK